MMKRLFLSMVAIVMAAAVFAQTVQDGVKFLYYEQFRKASEVFQKILAANPADPDANYWLGQTYIYDDNIAAARDLYAKAITATNQNPLVIVGVGHVELLDKKPADARKHFDAAIDLTKNKKNKNFGDPQVLASIGRANASGGTDIGDPNYAIEKLTQAAQLDLTNPEIPLNIGVSYLKKGGEFGGEAKKAFDAALERDPKYARAYMRIGRIFESQKNTPLFLENYNKAIEVDPTYSPAYLQLYAYYQNRDVNKAKELLDKYVANAQKSRELDFLQADYLLRAGELDKSFAKAKEIEAGLNGESYPKIYKLFSLIYTRKGDSINALKEQETYVTQENPAKLTGENYADLATLYLKANKDAVKAEQYINKAIEVDTSVDNKLNYINEIAAAFNANSDFKNQYKWLKTKDSIRPVNSALDYYTLTNAAIQAQEFAAADTLASRYIIAFPDQPQGYVLRLKGATLSDPDTSKGTAIPAIDQYNAFMQKDTAKYKNRIITNVGYKVYFYANKTKDYPKAIEALDEILALDPANQYAIAAKTQLQNILNKKPGAGTVTPKKTSGKLTKPINNPALLLSKSVS
jgi:tetratricopeptide (TPR) repeat protein